MVTIKKMEEVKIENNETGNCGGVENRNKTRKEYPKGTKRPNRKTKYGTNDEREKHYYEVRRERYAGDVCMRYFMKMINSKNEETRDELMKLFDNMSEIYEREVLDMRRK